ncbi:GDSL esterase/lipase 6-like [Camellia sinensis]|uniref:GDSL esterase/lipase 6-like n=1 Tax=Camellia sinensis TaxID=4442 RepID=UPI001036474E|nr:GDSL esterase/lipase 6-like [Camellia sinensis]
MESPYILLISLLLISFLFAPSLALAYNIRAIFTFGDSIFDAGNNHFNKNCTAQADFPPYGSSFFRHPTGRFTNGRTVVDFISQFVGIELQKPYLELQSEVVNGSMKEYPSNGINFASAGNGVLRGTNHYLIRENLEVPISLS